jgi:flagellar hook-basal body complex protein FliE
MLKIKPELRQVNPLPLRKTHERHIEAGRVVGFKGSYDRAGILSDTTPAGKGRAIAELGTKVGADAVLRMGSNGAAGMNRLDKASFANAMLDALDKVSALQHKPADLTVQASLDPSSVDPHDITTAEAKAKMALDIAATILSRATQAWRDLINTR